MSTHPMSQELRKIFDRLKRDATDTHFRWIFLKGLFGQDQKRLDLLNQSAGSFFSDIREVFIQDLVLGIARLTDPSGGHLSLSTLLRHIAEADRPALEPPLLQILDELEKTAAPVREYRHKIIAHRDRSVALGEDSLIHGALKFSSLTESLQLIAEFLNEVQLYHDDGTTGYEHGIESLDGIPALLTNLRLGQILRNWINEGRYGWDVLLDQDPGTA